MRPVSFERTTSAHHWFKSLMPYQLCQSVMSCQSQPVRPLCSHALLNLEKIEVQEAKLKDFLLSRSLVSTIG